MNKYGDKNVEKELTKEEKLKKDKKKIMSIVTVASKNRMTIPVPVRNTLELERGDTLVFLNYKNHIGLVKVREEFLFENLDINEDE